MARAWGVAALGVALLAGTAVVALNSRQADSATGSVRAIIPGLASDSRPTSTPTPTPIGSVPQTPTSLPTLPPTVVPITSYEAFASGLASNFTKGEICSLEQPFGLEGDAPPVSSNFLGTFIPTSATHGSYAFTNNILNGSCFDSSSGSYEVIFYSLGEGDIIMTGLVTRFCGGVIVFSDVTESRIAIREAPHLTCP